MLFIFLNIISTVECDHFICLHFILLLLLNVLGLINLQCSTTQSKTLKNKRGGRNVENQNVEGSERQKYFLNWSERRKWRVDQNVKNQNVESLKKNIKSLICLIFKFWRSVNYLWCKYLWHFGVKKSILKSFLACLNLT